VAVSRLPPEKCKRVRGGRPQVSPKSFVQRLKQDNELFRSFMHQDAHEFLNFLLNDCCETLERKQKVRGIRCANQTPYVAPCLGTFRAQTAFGRGAWRARRATRLGCGLTGDDWLGCSGGGAGGRGGGGFSGGGSSGGGEEEEDVGARGVRGHAHQ
jgi:uncharacterized membrane protein YgcG